MANGQASKSMISDRERVYEKLRDAILSNAIKPSERIVETVYAKKFNLSRTPVREALRMLEQEGLVEFTHSKGATARALPSVNEIKEVYSIRAMLQMMSVDNTVKNIAGDTLKEMDDCLRRCDEALEKKDEALFFKNHDRFNLLLLEGAKMPVLYKMLMQMEHYNPIISVAGTGTSSARATIRGAAIPGHKRQLAANTEHRDILEALKKRDRDAYAAALKIHLENSKGICMENCENMYFEMKDEDQRKLTGLEAAQESADLAPRHEPDARVNLLVLNGSNMNLLGERGALYGEITLDALDTRLIALADELQVSVECFQSNYEGDLVEKLHAARTDVDGVILNPAGFTFSGYSLRDAIAACKLRVIEVHITNMFNREEFRSQSVIAPVCEGYICGLNTEGYEMALRYFAQTCLRDQ